MKKKTPQSNSLSVFDWVKQIVAYKKDWNTFSEKDKSAYNIFLINRCLSMERDYLDVVNYVQKLNIQDKEKSYLVYCSLIPKSQKTYFQYIKAAKKEKLPELVSHMSKYYECSNREAVDYLELLPKNEIENILVSMGFDDKKIKELTEECK